MKNKEGRKSKTESRSKMSRRKWTGLESVSELDECLINTRNNKQDHEKKKNTSVDVAKPDKECTTKKVDIIFKTNLKPLTDTKNNFMDK